MIRKILLSLTLGTSLFMGLASAGEAQAADTADAKRPLALVWRGPGVCQPACGIAAARVARAAGFRPRSVYPGFHDEAAFAEAKLWVQPGGKSVNAARAMGPELMDRVRRFVADGGGYVGFCAGMFITTDQIGTSGKPGFGLVPGSTELFLKDDPAGKMIPVTLLNGTNEKKVKMYYAGGPMLHVNEPELAAFGGEVIARYEDESVAGVRVKFGQGRVAVVGFHPEAGWFWKAFKGIVDPRGEAWFAVQMIHSVTTESGN